MTDPYWEEYARIQHLVEIGKARDEQLDAFLKRQRCDTHQFDLYDCRRRAMNLDRNLRRKDRRHIAILTQNALHVSPAQADDPLDIILRRERCATVRQAAGQDWGLLRATIDGGYADFAMALNVAVGTMKARVSRAKSQLRTTLRELP